MIEISSSQSNCLRWLPRVFTNTLTTELELEKESYLIYLKVVPVEIYQYGYCWNKAYFLVVNFWIKAIAMLTSLLMTDKHIPHFGLNSLISTLSFGEIFPYFATSWKLYCLTFWIGKKSRLFRQFFQYSLTCHFSKYIRLTLTDFHKNKVFYRKWKEETRENLLSVLLFVLMLTS